MLFEEALKDSFLLKIYNKSMKGVLFSSKEEKEQFKLICFWKACKNFDESKSKFSTYLYNTINYSKLKYFEKCSKENKEICENYLLHNTQFFDKTPSLFIEECIPDRLLGTFNKVFIEKESIKNLEKVNKNIKKEIKEIKSLIKENYYQ